MTVHFGLTIHNSQTGIWLTGSVCLPPPRLQVIFFSVGIQAAQVSTVLSLRLGIHFGRKVFGGRYFCFGKLHKLSRLHDEAKGKLFYG
jgi:hypothetical protein